MLVLRVASWTLIVLAFAINAHALFAFVAARRADAQGVARLARRCFVSVLVVVALCVATLGLEAMLARSPQELDPSGRARFLAEMLSETINTFVFAALAGTLPVVAGWVLRRRARRA